MKDRIRVGSRRAGRTASLSIPERALALGLALALGAQAAGGHDAHERAKAAQVPPALAPGYGDLAFPAPEPGSYRLPPLGAAADGAVLGEDGAASTLHEVYGDRVVLLSFIFSSCSDVNGCPLATNVLHRVGRRLGADSEVAERLRLVSLSFDPLRDTPETMRRYGAGLADGPLEWRFLTTASPEGVESILEDYGQAVVVERDAQGRALGNLSHVLRVFLIDRQQRIRNIYTVSYLHADTLASDVRTLLLEAEGGSQSEVAASAPVAPRREVAASPPVAPRLRGPGDDRSGYESADYRTRSLALTARRGAAMDLLARVRRSALGLPPLPDPDGGALTAEKVALGRELFFDRRLSLNGTMSCAMCHVPEQGFTNNELATAVGIEGRTVRRNAPTLLNVAYRKRLFHDARETRLEQQVWGPLLAANEMGNPSIGAVLDAIRRAPEYAGRFEAAFPGRGLDMETLGAALASYERTLVSGDSPFDRWHYGGDETAVGEAAKRGFALFRRVGCAGCHTLGPDAALFSDGRVHNTGIGYRAAMGAPTGPRRIQVAPGQWIEVERDILARVSEPRPGDLGRYEVTQDPADRWKYLTPTLREVARTAPYMHDGSLATLRDVVVFYDAGGVPNPGLDPRIRPLDLAPSEVDDLVAFLESLSGGDVDALVADAFAAPIRDPAGD